ncbi:hypothetical protein EYF80_046281 [Liparis tanakae]|uniref:Uncharacterized protein n=1 Tax=Liparis tanakae TaxID=230148 RepID=A0A4Z2FQK9_9TELE|nr:hypothetical protein EYF80_046281 [Liparis tanakae]
MGFSRGLSCRVFCRYLRTKTLGAKWIMFCSPHPKGRRSSLSRLFRVGPITSPKLIQKLRNSSQERMPGVAAPISGSPILPKEIQERVFCRPPSTISSISALSWGLAERAKWASLWVFTATWNWFILAGFFTY